MTILKFSRFFETGSKSVLLEIFKPFTRPADILYVLSFSEMLLGPVPSGFHFLPKHKANSYTEAEG